MVEELKRIPNPNDVWVTEDENGDEHTLGYYPSLYGPLSIHWMNHGCCHRESGKDWVDKLNTGRMTIYWTLYNKPLHGRLLLW